MSLKTDISEYVLLTDEIIQKKDSEIENLKKEASEAKQVQPVEDHSEELQKLAEQVAEFVKLHDKNADVDSVLKIAKEKPQDLSELFQKAASALIRAPSSMGRVVKKNEKTVAKNSDRMFEERFLNLSRRIGD